VKIPKVLNSSTNKKDKLTSTSWAIKYKSEEYINFRYSEDYQNLEIYVKPDTSYGMYYLVFIDNDTENMIKSGGTNYGGGLQGYLMKESDRWGKSWKNKKEEKVKILLFDTSIQDQKHIKGHKNSIGKLVTRKNINEVLGAKLTKEKIKYLKFEDVIELIKNQK